MSTHLALFDLDNTLLPIDSDYEWGRFLARSGVVDGIAHERTNLAFYEQYKAGTLNITEFLRFSLSPLAAHPREKLDAWHARFMQEVVTPAIRPAARALVDAHLQRGDLVALVTATNRFVTAPIARAFGIAHLVATDIEERADGSFTGEPRGTPSFQAGKITCTDAWLASQGRAWTEFETVSFYSDSLNDLPLLERATHPVATNPDSTLARIAAERGWRVLELFA